MIDKNMSKRPESTKDLTLRALRHYRGDNLERAEMQFKGLSGRGMDQPFGGTGLSNREILDAYRGERRAVDEAIMWVTSM